MPRGTLIPATTMQPTPNPGNFINDLQRELRDMAHRFMRGERPEHTLQTTALVNEAWLKLSKSDQQACDRIAFLAYAARAMRQILVDHARTRDRLKRGGASTKQPLDELVLACEERSGDLVALDAALEQLAQHDPTKAQLIELRFFGGLEMIEAAETLGLARRTAERHWTMARAWLKSQLDNTQDDDA